MMAQPNTNQKKRKPSGLPASGPQVPSWYGSQQQQTFPTVPAYSRMAPQPNVAVSGLSNLLDMFSGAGNRARLGMRQNLNYNNLPGRTPPAGTPGYNLPRMSQGQMATPQQAAQPAMQTGLPLPPPRQLVIPQAGGTTQEDLNAMFGPLTRPASMVVSSGLPTGWVEQQKQQMTGPTREEMQTTLNQQFGPLTQPTRIISPETEAMVNQSIQQGNADVDFASRTGIPTGGMTADQTRDAYMTQQRIQAAQAAQEAQRGMLGPGPSGIPLTPRDAAAQGNMAQGTPWQPVPGTVGLPAYVSQSQRDQQEFEAMDRAKAAEAQRFADFTANMDPNASYYEGMGRGRPQPEYKTTKAYAAMKERAAVPRPKLDAKGLNQRAAVYARAHGLPMNTALLQLTAMDEQGRAAGEDRQPNLSSDQRAANPAMMAGMTADNQMEVARQNALSNAMAGFGNYAGTLTPELLGRVTGAFPQPTTGLPGTPATTTPTLTPAQLQAIGNNPDAMAKIQQNQQAIAEVDSNPRIAAQFKEPIKAAIEAGDWTQITNYLIASGMQPDEAIRLTDSLRGVAPGIEMEYWSTPGAMMPFGG